MIRKEWYTVYHPMREMPPGEWRDWFVYCFIFMVL